MKTVYVELVEPSWTSRETKVKTSCRTSELGRFSSRGLGLGSAGSFKSPLATVIDLQSHMCSNRGPQCDVQGHPWGARSKNLGGPVGPSDVPEITEDWYRERGIVNCPMRDEPLLRKSFNVTSAASAVDESYIRLAPRPEGAISL